MQVDINIPDGKSGSWEVTTFEVPKNDISQIISLMKTGRGVPPGTYKQLSRNGKCIMSNTPDEIRDVSSFVYKANGNILINGLGLGVVLKMLLGKKEVTKITVIEKSQDVINLIAPHYNDERITIINADAFEWTPPKGEKYDYVWHDIWDDITSDNLPEMKKLHRKYGKRAGYQESWCRSLCEYYQKQSQRNSWR